VIKNVLTSLIQTQYTNLARHGNRAIKHFKTEHQILTWVLFKRKFKSKRKF